MKKGCLGPVVMILFCLYLAYVIILAPLVLVLGATTAAAKQGSDFIKQVTSLDVSGILGDLGLGGSPGGGSGPNPTPIPVSGPGDWGLSVYTAATQILPHLYGVPDQYYDSQIPPGVLAFWQSACPGGSDCWVDWQQGQLQCVLFVTGAYALAGHQLPAAGNAVKFWSLYAGRSQPGWTEIPEGEGLPQPGDIIVWWDAPPAVGHVAIALRVTAPNGTAAGQLEFGEANGPKPVVDEVIRPDLTIQTWPGYRVLGYIRHVG